MSNLVQNALIIVGIIAVGLLGAYLYVVQTGQSLTIPSFRSEPTVVDVTSQEFLSRLQLLESIELDTERLFSDQHFQALVDFSRPVEPAPVGRSNPFAVND